LKKRDSYPDQVPDSRTMGRGVLHPDLAATRFALARIQPSAELAPFVDFYWIVRWDLRGQPAYQQTILPHPCVNLAFEASGAGILGVDRRLFSRELTGRGRAFGVRFRAGCFRPFWQAPVSQLTDRVVPAARLFGSRAEQTRRAIMRADAVSGTGGRAVADRAVADRAIADRAIADRAIADGEMTAHAEALLSSVRPEGDPVAERAADLVARITADPALRRVDELAAVAGLTVRSLQRLFADYVGVSPKWVMRRARLHEAAERADSGELVDWAELAADLGYADQAHLTRDFTATLGVPPAHYAGQAGVDGSDGSDGMAGSDGTDGVLDG
jgi:AraC-like DNA-binding protein